MTNPYSNLPPSSFWADAMAQCPPSDVDPFIRHEQIGASEKIATMGSCFAQHLSRHVAEIGLTYYVAESGEPTLDAATRKARGFGVFSARYGNVYTVRQALQLFQRAFGHFRPSDDVWLRDDGRYVDAFRPRIEPDGFGSPEEVRAEAAAHLQYVRNVFTDSQWLIFTMGLTESWQSRVDGAVYPLAPGVAGGEFDPDRYDFVNASVGATIADLSALVEAIDGVNKNIKVLLTVSPVALVATYEPRHVLTSTVCSKAILRAAADEAERRFKNVIYFPSYEIITSPASEGRYYADDLRQVNQQGIDHVMRVFTKHFVEEHGEDVPSHDRAPIFLAPDPEVVCDEEEIRHSFKKAGM